MQKRQHSGQVLADRLPLIPLARNTSGKGRRLRPFFSLTRKMIKQPTITLRYYLVLLIGVLACILAYWPGLRGGFLFDDFANLPVLGFDGLINTWPKLLRYITSGVADPTGRPLTMLTFLIDARTWPAAPLPFKRTNLILHVLNGILLAAVLRRLGIATFLHAGRRRIDVAAALAATFWLLHPLFVSTTLYIVQREAMLPVTFTLLGILFWLRGRRCLQNGSFKSGLTWITLGLGACTLLGTLCKANGILLPALALTIEHILLPRPTKFLPADVELAKPQLAVDAPGPRCTEKWPRRSWIWYRAALAAFGWFPAALVGWLLFDSAWKGFVNGVSDLRPWTLGQRLLTEPRILVRYLDLLWLPRPFTPGLFNDQINASLSLWSPLTTLLSIAGLLALIAGAVLVRKRWPALAAAVLFYFVAQSIESSTIPLELYYEHRNYLPAIFMFWPLALWLCAVRRVEHPSLNPEPTGQLASSFAGQKSVAISDWARGLLALTLVLSLALMTRAGAQLWGNTRDQGELWASMNPDSPRAQTNAALLEMADGRPVIAIGRINRLLIAKPAQAQLALNLISAHCQMGKIAPGVLSKARYAIANTRDPGTLLTHWFDASLSLVATGRCQGLDLKALDDLIDAGLTNKKLMAIGGRRQDLLHEKGRIALAQHDPSLALNYFDAALFQDVRPGAALEQAAELGAAGYPREGLMHLDKYARVKQLAVAPNPGMPWLHALVIAHQRYWPNEIAELRDTLQRDIESKAANNK